MVRSPSCHALLVALSIATACACSKGETLDDLSTVEPDAPSQAAAVSAPAPVPTASASASTSVEPLESPVLQFESNDGPSPAAEALRILHVGDSMVPLVGNYLRQILAKEGRRYEIVSIPSSSTLSWARDHGLRDAMYRYDPQVVLISLGSNELFDPNPTRRALAIRQIVAETRDRPCLWIGPPAWKKDRGFLQVLEQNVGRCRYFDSAKLSLDRMADGRHPSWTGSHKWAVEVWKVLGGTQPVPSGNARPKQP